MLELDKNRENQAEWSYYGDTCNSQGGSSSSFGTFRCPLLMRSSVFASQPRDWAWNRAVPRFFYMIVVLGLWRFCFICVYFETVPIQLGFLKWMIIINKAPNTVGAPESPEFVNLCFCRHPDSFFLLSSRCLLHNLWSLRILVISKVFVLASYWPWANTART